MVQALTPQSVLAVQAMHTEPVQRPLAQSVAVVQAVVQTPPLAVSQEPTKLVPQLAKSVHAAHTFVVVLQRLLPQSVLVVQDVPQMPVPVLHELMPQS